MGFMASGAGAFAESFGKAFSNSYQSGLDRNASKAEKEEARKYNSEQMLKSNEHDIFLTNMKLAAEQKTKYEEAKAKDSKLVSAAEGISSDTGAPKEWTAARLKDGYTVAQVRTMAAGYDWRQGSAQTAPQATGQSAPQSAPTQPGLDQNKAGATQEQMDMAFPSENGSEDVPDESVDNAPTEGADLTEGLPPSTRPEAAANGGPEIRVGDVVGVPRKQEKSQTFDQTVDGLRQNLLKAKESKNPEAIQAATSALMSAVDVDRMDDKPGSLDMGGLYLAAASDDPVLAAQANKALDIQERAELLKAAREGGGTFVFDQTKGKLVQAEPVIGEDGRRSYVGQDGSPMTNVIMPDKRFYEKYDEVLKLKTEEPYRKYDAKIAATSNVVKASAELAQIVEKNEAVLTYTASLTELAKGLGQEAKAALKILSAENRGEIDPSQIDALDKDLNIMSQQTSDTATLSAIYDAKKKVLSYRVAEMNGQSGRDLSNSDVGRFDDIIQPSKDAPTVIRNLANVSKAAISDLTPVAATLNNDPRVTTFAAQYGSVPIEGGFAAEPFDRYVARMNDPEINNALAYLKGKEGSEVGDSPNKPPEVVSQPSSKEEFDKLPSGTVFIDPQGNKRRKP